MSGSLLVWLPTWLGDTVLATPVLRSLREGLPRVRIGLLGPPALEELLRGAPWFDEYVPYDKRGGDRGAMGALRLASRLRLGRWQTILLLPNSLRSSLVAYLSRIPRRAGYRGQGRSAFLTDGLDPEREDGRRVPVPMTPYYMALLSTLGVEPLPTRPWLPVSVEEDVEAVDWLRENGVRDGETLVGFAPGASFGPSKLWPEDRWGILGTRLREDGHRLLVFHGPGEQALAARIEDRIGGDVLRSTRRRPTLGFLKAATRRLSLLVTTDAGPRHVATAFDRPTVVLMGPNDPRLTACFLDRTEIVRVEVDCGPCAKPHCVTDGRCMTRIEPDRVLASCRAWLRRVPPVPALESPPTGTAVPPGG